MSDIEQLKKSISILALASNLGIKLTGKNRARCIHGKKDSTPSLRFYPESNTYCCYSCSISGDVFDLYMDVTKTDWKGAVEALINKGVKLPNVEVVVEEKQGLPDASIIDSYVGHFWKEASPAYTYMHSRGISDSVLKQQKIGYHPARNAVVIPAYNIAGELTAIKYRNLDPKASLRYWSEKGSTSTLYNQQNVNPQVPYIVLCAGEIDLMSLLTAGINNAVSSTTGEGMLKPEWEAYLAASNPIIILDNDVTGKSKIDEYTKRLPQATGVYLSNFFKDVKDLNDVLRKHGANNPLFSYLRYLESSRKIA